jgi:hypothetical protein
MTPDSTAIFRIVEVETVPEPLERGVVYISDKYALAIHLCAGGCDSEVVMKTAPMFDGDGHFWTMTRVGDTVTFSPSILQGGCNHHYFIEANQVRWA